jgi:hypothetical protein
MVAFACPGTWIVVSIHLGSDAAECGHNRAPPGFRWMRGQNRADLEVGNGGRDVVGADRHDRPRKRVVSRFGVCEIARPKHPYAVALLGKVDEMEEHGERVRDLVGTIDRHGIDKPARRTGVAATARVSRSPAQALDVVVQALAAGLGDNLAEQAAEEPHIIAKRAELIRSLACHEPEA